MNKAAITIGIFFILASVDIARAQIALSTYFCETSVAESATIDKFTQTCSRPVLNRVLSTSRRLLPFSFSFCTDDGSIGLDLPSRTLSLTYIKVTCGDNFFVALDPSKTTLAAEFYYACLDAAIIKCPDYQVFDQSVARCIPRTSVLSSGLATCGTPVTKTALSTAFCESQLFSTLKPTCATCLAPFAELLSTTEFDALPAFYTFCAENGRFSLDTNIGMEPHTFFTPYCTGTNPLLPLDATKTTLATKLYWDCRAGLFACPGNLIFDPIKNNCVENTSTVTPTNGLSTCTKTCPAPYYGGAYGSPYGYGSYGTPVPTPVPTPMPVPTVMPTPVVGMMTW